MTAIARWLAVFAILPGWGLVAPPAVARPVPNLTPAQVQRLIGGLTRFENQNFFVQGQDQLEREIAQLRQRFLDQDGILQISPDLQVPPDFSPLEQAPPPLESSTTFQQPLKFTPQ